MRVVLTIVEGVGSGTAAVLDGYNSFILGRSSRAHAQLEIPVDPFMSRYHVLVECDQRGCRVVDLNSSNGVFVNGERVDQMEIRSGDLLRAGRTTLRAEVEAPESDGEPGSERRSSPSPGSPSLEAYEIIERVAEGSVGAVYRARHRVSGKTVAIKRLHAHHRMNASAIQHFLREARIATELRHPCIVRTLDSGESDGTPWLAMEFIEGRSLQEQTTIFDVLAPVDARSVGCHLLDGLAFAHARGFIHRDVKPANVLLPDAEGGAVAMLADFSLAKSLRHSGTVSLTVTGDAKGTPLYMAPEQFENAKSVTASADQYGVGATLYHALTGERHLDSEGAGNNMVRTILMGKYVPIRERRGIPADLAAVVDRALCRDPGERFPTTKAMHRALFQTLAGGAL